MTQNPNLLAEPFAVEGAGLQAPLTGLPSMGVFHDRFGQALVQSRRRGSRVAVLVIALDGAELGEQVFTLAAHRLQTATRARDSVCRSGEAFLAVLPDAGESRSVATVVARLISVLNTPHELDGRHVAVRASIGSAVFPDDGDSDHELLEKAAAAMAAARTEARGSMTWRQLDGPSHQADGAARGRAP